MDAHFLISWAWTCFITNVAVFYLNQLHLSYACWCIFNVWYAPLRLPCACACLRKRLEVLYAYIRHTHIHHQRVFFLPCNENCEIQVGDFTCLVDLLTLRVFFRVDDQRLCLDHGCIPSRKFAPSPSLITSLTTICEDADSSPDRRSGLRRIARNFEQRTPETSIRSRPFFQLNGDSLSLWNK